MVYVPSIRYSFCGVSGAPPVKPHIGRPQKNEAVPHVQRIFFPLNFSCRFVDFPLPAHSPFCSCSFIVGSACNGSVRCIRHLYWIVGQSVLRIARPILVDIHRPIDCGDVTGNFYEYYCILNRTALPTVPLTFPRSISVTSTTSIIKSQYRHETASGTLFIVSLMTCGSNRNVRMSQANVPRSKVSRLPELCHFDTHEILIHPMLRFISHQSSRWDKLALGENALCKTRFLMKFIIMKCTQNGGYDFLSGRKLQFGLASTEVIFAQVMFAAPCSHVFSTRKQDPFKSAAHLYAI